MISIYAFIYFEKKIVLLLGKSKSYAGEIAGAVVGSLVLIAVVATIVVLLFRRNRDTNQNINSE